MQIQISLDDYPEIIKTTDFTVTIDPCTVDVFEIASGPETQDYTIREAEKNLGTLVGSQGAC